MIEKHGRYKIIIGVLLLIIVVQTFFILKILTKKKVKPALPSRIRPKIAIVLDDWGYNEDSLTLLESINYPLNMAILPNLVYSHRTVQKAKELNKEIILHLPLQSKQGNKLGWEKNTITVDMPEEKIREILNEAIDSLGEIKGVSNHMGSLATEDERTMRVIFLELKKRGIYFLDNRASPKTVCERLAKQLSLKFVKRDVFLDNEKEPLYIKNQLKKLAAIALKYGQAIGVGHNHKVTLKVLKEFLPQLEKAGFEFVFLSQLIK